MKKAREKIREALEGARNPVVLCGFGKDSMLLLYLAREVVPNIPVLWFRQDLMSSQRAFAESVIRDWNLTVCGYAPRERYYLPTSSGLTLINEYSIGGASLPVLVDVREGRRCGLKIDRTRTPLFAYPWDVSLVGWKSSDGHELLGVNPFPPDGFPMDGTRFYAPLRHMTDEGVWEAIYREDVPYDRRRYDARDDMADPDSLLVCTRCLGGEGNIFCPELQQRIPVFDWNRQGALTRFRERYRPQGE